MTTIAVPHLAREHVVRAVAGLRPFRPAGVRTELEWIAGRPVVHNYGHGGSGVTLAPGTAAVAADLAAGTGARRAAVLGAGAVGLCTARELQRHGVEVTVYAMERSPATTSNVAGALWGTFTIVDPAYATPETGARLAQLSRASHRFFSALPADRYGVRRIPLYLVGAAAELPWEMALTPELFPAAHLARDEHPFAAARVLRTASLMIEPERFLAAMEADVVAAGRGRIAARRFASLDDVLALEEDVVVNCLGLGARSVFGDETVVPIKGELALLAPQPAIDYAVISLDDDAYILPREGALVVGGSRVRGDMTPAPRAAEIDLILARARAMYRKGRN